MNSVKEKILKIVEGKQKMGLRMLVLLCSGLLVGFLIGHIMSPRVQIDYGLQRIVRNFTCGNDTYVIVEYFCDGFYHAWIGKELPNGTIEWYLQEEVQPKGLKG